MPELTPKRLQGFATQCLNDDKMAESIYEYLRKHPDSVVLHINGCFHSDRHLGTVERMQQRAPQLKLAIISPQDMPGRVAQPHNVYKKNKGEGEFLIFFPRVAVADR